MNCRDFLFHTPSFVSFSNSFNRHMFWVQIALSWLILYAYNCMHTSIALLTVFLELLYLRCSNRRVAGVVDRGRLEICCTLRGTGGSNPSLSAVSQRLCIKKQIQQYQQ